MAALHIRDISDALLKQLKKDAVECGLTLKQYVVGKLATPSGSGVVKQDHASLISSNSECNSRLRNQNEVEDEESREDQDSGAMDVPRSEAVPTVSGREPARTRKRKPAGKRAGNGDKPTCIHGAEKGYYCGMCGGKAKIVE